MPHAIPSCWSWSNLYFFYITTLIILSKYCAKINGYCNKCKDFKILKITFNFSYIPSCSPIHHFRKMSRMCSTLKSLFPSVSNFSIHAKLHFMGFWFCCTRNPYVSNLWNRISTFKRGNYEQNRRGGRRKFFLEIEQLFPKLYCHYAFSSTFEFKFESHYEIYPYY